MSKEVPCSTPSLGPQSLNQMMDSRTRLPSNRLFCTPRIDGLVDGNNTIKKNESLAEWYKSWAPLVSKISEKTFLVEHSNSIEDQFRVQLYKDAYNLVHNSVLTLDLTKDLIKPTLTFYSYMLNYTINDENEKITKDKLKELLSMKEFTHSCLLCGFITSLICFSIPIQSYSSLLFIFGIQAYDIHRVTETYVARLAVFKQNSLPLEIYKTFSILMESCIEELIWTHESTVWKYLLPAESDEHSSSSEHASSDIHMGAIPKAVEIIIRHLLYISLVRLQTIISQLHLTAEQRQFLVVDSYSLFRAILKNSFALLEGRHLDSILLSTLYATSKVRNIVMKFKELLQTYGELYPTKVEKIKMHVSLLPLRTTRTPFKDTTEVTEGNIILFYNKIFVEACHPQLTQYQTEIHDSQKINQSGPTSSLSLSQPNPMVCESPSIFTEAKSVVRSLSVGVEKREPLLSPLPLLPQQAGTMRNSFMSPHPSILSPTVKTNPSQGSIQPRSLSLTKEKTTPDPLSSSPSESVKRPAEEETQDRKQCMLLWGGVDD